MLPYRDSRITRITLVVFFILVAGYAYYEGRGLLFGPTIEIENRVMETSASFVVIEGVARRVATLSMNGKEIPVTEEGAFSEGYVLTPGYNHVVLSASDRWGKTTERSIEIIYVPSANSNAPPQTGPQTSSASAPTSSPALR
jgi:hypothetical protein